MDKVVRKRANGNFYNKKTIPEKIGLWIGIVAGIVAICGGLLSIFSFIESHSDAKINEPQIDDSDWNTKEEIANNDTKSNDVDSDEIIILENKVRVVGSDDKSFKRVVEAQVGDIIEFQIQYINNSDTKHENVIIYDILPKNLKYISGTTKLWNANHKNGFSVIDDTIVTDEGYNIGAYTAGSNAYIRFKVVVERDGLNNGVTAMVNWSQCKASTDENIKSFKDYSTAVIGYNISDLTNQHK